MPELEFFESTEAVERLRFYSEELLPPRVSQFAHFLADRLSRRVDPEGFILSSYLSINDLQQGIDGDTGEQLSGDLVGLRDEEYNEIVVNIPNLARAAFPAKFAEAVREHMINSGLLHFKIPDQEQLVEGEVIEEEITDIDTAFEKIVLGAKSEVIDFDWQGLGVTTDEVVRFFDASYPLLLRQSSFKVPINILIDTPKHEAQLVPEYFSYQKKHIKNNVWLGLMTDVIDPDLATFTKDLLTLKSIEFIAIFTKLDPQTVVRYLMDNDQTGVAHRAGLRMLDYKFKHQDIVKVKDSEE